MSRPVPRAALARYLVDMLGDMERLAIAAGFAGLARILRLAHSEAVRQHQQERGDE